MRKAEERQSCGLEEAEFSNETHQTYEFSGPKKHFGEGGMQPSVFEQPCRCLMRANVSCWLGPAPAQRQH